MHNVTVGFDPWQLSTVGSVDGIQTPLNLDDLRNCDEAVSSYTGSQTDIWGDRSPERCLPSLQWSPDDWNITAVNSLWTTCNLVGGLVFDPPRTWVTVSAVSPLTTTVDPTVITKLMPGSTFTPLAPITTSVPSSTARNTQGEDPGLVGGPTPFPASASKLHQPEQTVTKSTKPGLVAGTHSYPTHLPAQGDLPNEGSNGEGAVGDSNNAQSRVFDTGSGNDLGGGLPGIPLDPFNNPGASHTVLQDPNGQAAVPTNIAGHPATILPHSIEIGPTTLRQGGPPMTVSGTVLSLGSSAVVIASKTVQLPQSQQAIATIAGTPLVYHPNAVAIAGDMLTPGASPKTLSDGVVVSVDASSVVAAPKPLALPQSKPTVTKFLGHDMTLLPHAVVISGTTLTPGGSPFTLSGMTMTVGPSSLSLGSQVLPFSALQHLTAIPTQKPDPISGHTAGGVTLHGSRISVDSNGNVVIDGTTLKPGNPDMTLDGHSISVAPGQSLVFDGSTLTPGGSAMTLDDMPVSMNPNGDLVVAGTTLSPESDAVQIGSTPISVAPNGGIVIGGTTLKAGGPAATVKGSTISVAPNGDPVLDGTTLIPGGSPMTVDGTPFSVASDGDLVVDGTTLLPSSNATFSGNVPISLASNGALIIAGTTLNPGGDGAALGDMSVSVAPDGDLVLAGTILIPGGAVVTINGRTVSVAPDGSVVIDGSTLRLRATPGVTPGAATSATGTSTSSTGGLGALITGAFGDRPTVASSTSTSSKSRAAEGKTTSAIEKKFIIIMVVLLSVVLGRFF